MKIRKVPAIVFAAIIVAIPAVISNTHVAGLFGLYAPPPQCQKWYDGCNMCTTNENGSVTCGRRVCDRKGKGFCTSYVSAIDAPTAPRS